MRKLFGLILILFVSANTIGQQDSIRVYNWEEVLNANPDTVFGISFTKMKLDSLPAELVNFKKLIVLNVSKNKLSDLPSFVSEFKSLKILNIEKNQFDKMPIEICGLINIEKLILNRNNIETLPECIGFLEKLEYIDLFDNPIRTLPESIALLTNLKEIDLSGIKFSPTFQNSWKSKLPKVIFVFDAPCDCME